MSFIIRLKHIFSKSAFQKVPISLGKQLLAPAAAAAAAQSAPQNIELRIWLDYASWELIDTIIAILGVA